MLAKTTNFLVENQTGGAGLTIQFTYCRWKFGTDGALVYETPQPSPFTIANNVDGTLSTPGGALDNTSGLFLGMHCTVTATVNTGTGDWYVYLAIEANGTESATAGQVMLVAGTGSTLIYQFEL